MDKFRRSTRGDARDDAASESPRARATVSLLALGSPGRRAFAPLAALRSSTAGGPGRGGWRVSAIGYRPRRLASFNWIRVRGVVTATSDEDDSALAVQHNIRVFAQVEGPEKQAIATQGDLNSGFNTRKTRARAGAWPRASADDERRRRRRAGEVSEGVSRRVHHARRLGEVLGGGVRERERGSGRGGREEERRETVEQRRKRRRWRRWKRFFAGRGPAGDPGSRAAASGARAGGAPRTTRRRYGTEYLATQSTSSTSSTRDTRPAARGGVEKRRNVST